MSEEATLDEFQNKLEGDQRQDWRKVKLGEVSWKRSENVDPQEVDIDRHVGLEHIEPNTPSPNWEPLDDLSSTKRRFHSGDILFAKLRPNLEKSAQPDFEGVSSTDIFPIVAEQGINSKYLLYRLSSKPAFDYARRTSAGTRMPRTSWNLFSNFEFDLPSVIEQRKIATILYTVDRAIEKTKKILDQSRQIKKGVVQNLMTKGAQQHTSYEDYRLGPIDLTKPKEWDLRSFGDFSFRIQDGPHITPDYVDEGVSFVSSQNVNPFGEEFDYSQYEKYISESTYEEINQNCRPEKGDLIISRRATIGPTQLIRHNDQFGYFVGVAVIKTDDTVYNPFLEQLMNWSVMNKLWHLKSPGSTMKTLNLGTIKEQKIPVPSIQEQKEIAEMIGSIDKEIANNQRYKESLQHLKRGLQQDLLSGTVRTTNTNIEIPDEIAQHG